MKNSLKDINNKSSKNRYDSPMSITEIKLKINKYFTKKTLHSLVNTILSEN